MNVKGETNVFTDMNIDDYDSALLFNEDGTADMSIRKLADEDEVSEGTLRAVAISFLLANNDSEFMEIVNRKIDELLADAVNSETEE